MDALDRIKRRNKFKTMGYILVDKSKGRLFGHGLLFDKKSDVTTPFKGWKKFYKIQKVRKFNR